MADAFKLTPEQQTALNNMAPELNAARATIEKLKRAGVNVTEQEDRLNQAIQMRDGFLREFGRPLPSR